MSRQQVGLRAPQPGDAEQVPVTGRRRPLYRACANTHPQPWWFSSRDTDDPGRFDLERPHGTCYWALSAGAAVVEAATDPDQIDPPVLTVAALQRLVVWRADQVPAARSRLADTTVRSVPGLTDELGTVVPYTLPWLWADAFFAAGRSGVLYRGRFAMEESMALFGTSGQPTDGPDAERRAALSHVNELPPAFRAGIGTVGSLDQLERAPAP